MSFLDHSFISLKDTEFLINQRIAGKCVAACLNTTVSMVHSSNANLLDLQEACDKIFDQFGCTPTFYQYKGFPGKICLSVNNELVHGIPKNYKIKNGDIVKIDLGATYDGAIADAARTVICREPVSSKHVEIINICSKALDNAINNIKIGKRIGSIGQAIFRTVKETNFGLVTDYGGHGIDLNIPHASPFIANKSQPDSGPRFQQGMCLAIEPMVVLGNPKTRVSKDGWTVMCDSVSSHFEDTIFIHDDSVEILTR